MKITADEISLYLSGQPVKIEKCNIFISQPTLKQIVMFGEASFLSITQLLSKTDDLISVLKKENSELSEFSDFQIMMIVFSQDKELQKRLTNFFKLVCPDYTVEITENNIAFKIDDNAVGMINQFNFSDFQNVVSNLFCMRSSEDEMDYNPANEKAKEIMDKIKEGQKKRAEIKMNDGEIRCLFGTYTSILAIGLQMDINIFYNYTPFQIYDAFQRYWNKVNSDFYMKVSTTPLMDVSKMSKPEDWTRGLY